MLVFTYALDADTAQGIDMTTGRKSKYDPEETITKAEDYYKNWAKLDAKAGGAIPTVEGLALHLNVHRDTIHEWCKHDDKEEFSDIVKDIKTLQGLYLVNKTLIGDFKERTAGALLHHHDYGEKKQVDHISSDGSFSFSWEDD